jgi:non-heme chloroperoxidase
MARTAANTFIQPPLSEIDYITCRAVEANIGPRVQRRANRPNRPKMAGDFLDMACETDAPYLVTKPTRPTMLKKMLLWICVIVMWASRAHAQDISGDWQGTLNAGPRQLRTIIRIDKADNGGWNLKMYSIDQTPDWGAGIPANSVSIEGSDIKFTIDAIRGVYEGKLGQNGTSIKGTWTQRAKLPLDFERATKDTAWRDPSPHTVQLITVDKDVKLEVLDWGGTGRPLVFLAGLGNTAHVFDKFAPKFTDGYHIYGITRRGFGDSSAPATGYSADRLGDDVVAVLDALKLNQPVLIGHSIAGEELSSVATRHRERVAGLVYLDAAYGYAYYDSVNGELRIDALDLQKKLERLRQLPPDAKQLVQELLQTSLPRFQKELQELELRLPAATPPLPPAAIAMQDGLQKYMDIRVPALAIYAVPKDLGPAAAFGGEERRVALEALDTARTEAQVKAFETGVPSSRVVRLAHANHYVFLSNEADVMREVHAFLDSLH